MIFKISLILHIIGFTLLMAGLFIGIRSARCKQPAAELLKSIRFGYLLPGILLVIVSGFFQFFYHGAGYYFSQSWFHGKLTVGLLLVAIACWLFVKISAVEITGQALDRKLSAIMNSAVGILFVSAISLVLLGRS